MEPLGSAMPTLRHFEEPSNAEAARVPGQAEMAASARASAPRSGCRRPWPETPACGPLGRTHSPARGTANVPG